MNQSLSDLALQFAMVAHQGQTRKYAATPYIYHCIEVATLVRFVGGTEEMIAAAYLHDVVEDTETTVGEVISLFGTKVASYVLALTNSPKELGNRAKRKALDCARLASSPPEVHTIKLADLISNTESIARLDPDFAKVYMEEKRDLLQSLVGGNEVLFDEAKGIVDKYFIRGGPGCYE